ncbi:MAG TPA: hypothetical protein VFV66_35910 [Nonomuraea sp.]|nr:hypothetical protein [Nonomuraea sp.]
MSLAVTGPTGLLDPLAQPGWAVALLVAGTAGELGQTVYAVTNVSLRQRLLPRAHARPVNATMRFLMMGLFHPGRAAREVAGPRQALWAATVVIVLSPLPVYAALRGIRDVEDVSPGDGP